MTGQTSTLLARDLDRAVEVCVPERLRSRRDLTVTELAHEIQRSLTGCMTGGCTSCDDGPYSDGRNPEYWSFVYDQCARGFNVEIDHTVRATDERTTLRQGLVTWRELAERVLANAGALDEQLSIGAIA